MRRMGRSSRGYTLVELMLTVGIIGIVASLNAGNYRGFFRRSYFREFTQATLDGLNLARAEAIRRGRTVRCVLGPDTVTVFVDIDGDGVVDEGEDTVFNYPSGVGWFEVRQGTEQSTIRAGMEFSSSHSLYVIFNSQGYSIDTAYEFRDMSFAATDTEAPASRVKNFEVSVAGSIRIVD